MVLPRTLALEQRIHIGAGFHNKWYASQGEHWCGWMGYQGVILKKRGLDPACVPASKRWNLHCLPMMFWLAEAVALPAAVLDRAKIMAEAAAAKIDHDHPSHGKAMRAVLPWEMIELALASLPPLTVEAATAAEVAVTRAHQKLVDKLGRSYA